MPGVIASYSGLSVHREGLIAGDGVSLCGKPWGLDHVHIGDRKTCSPHRLAHNRHLPKHHDLGRNSAQSISHGVEKPAAS